jgi:choline dehydrogenase-like flavoprotein
VGKRTFLHPVVVSAARFEDAVEGFYGAPQSVYSKHFIDRGPDKIGFFIEVPPIHPMLASTLGGFGPSLGDLLTQLPQLQAMIGITVDGLLPGDEGGTVGLRNGGHRLDIEYPLQPANWEVFQFALREMANLQFAAGALEVYTPHTDPIVLRSEEDLSKLDRAPWERMRLKVVTAHQMGGCALGQKQETSVVGPDFRVWEMDNLFVTDGSLFPTAVGVNPQISIYGLARLAATKIATY